MAQSVVILAGGFGTRLGDLTQVSPKPMVPIGKFPILLHIMARYSKYGHNRFIICGGYKIEVITNYFRNLYDAVCDTKITYHQGSAQEMWLEENDTRVISPSMIERWEIVISDGGLNTTTSGRLKAIKKYINDDVFFCTYGDGVANVQIDQLLAFHKSQDKVATVTAVNPPSRYGDMEFNGQGKVTKFQEKQIDKAFINGGFFVFNRSIFERLDASISLEEGLLTNLTNEGELNAFSHRGFWQNMDTPREHRVLNEMYESDRALWLK